mgnify:CR=1 FL=1
MIWTLTKATRTTPQRHTSVAGTVTRHIKHHGVTSSVYEAHSASGVRIGAYLTATDAIKACERFSRQGDRDTSLPVPAPRRERVEAGPYTPIAVLTELCADLPDEVDGETKAEKIARWSGLAAHRDCPGTGNPGIYGSREHPEAGGMTQMPWRCFICRKPTDCPHREPELVVWAEQGMPRSWQKATSESGKRRAAAQRARAEARRRWYLLETGRQEAA